jgi:hypothetical protein
VGRRLTVDRMLLAGALLVVLAIAVRPAIDNDLWWHLRSGRWMVDHHRILGADPFAHTTHGKRRLPFDWLGQLGLYGLWCVGRLRLVAVVTGLLATASVALTVLAVPGRATVRAAVAVLTGATASVFWSARPQMATNLLVAVVVWALWRHRRTGQTLWWLVPMFVLWAQLHLGWLYGLALIWATVVGSLVDQRLHRPGTAAVRAGHLAVVGALSSLAVMVSPVGPQVYGLFFTQASVGRSYIEEYQAPSPTDGKAVPFFVLLAIVAVVLVVRRRHVAFTDGLLITGTAAFALTALRAIPVFAAVAAPVLVEQGSALLEARRPRIDRRPAPIDTVILGATAIAVLVILFVRLSPSAVTREERREFPVAATAWLRRAQPAGRLWNTFDWGGYLIWKAPEYKVSIDGRADLHEDRLATSGRTLAGEGWQADFDGQGINVAMVDTGGPLARALAASPDWEVGYRDDQATCFIRRRSLP